MFALTLHNIVNLLLHYRYLLLFPIAVIEGPIIAIISGFLINGRVFSILPTYLILLSGDVVGDLLYYGIGRWGGRAFVIRFGKYIGVEHDDLENFRQKFNSNSKKILLFGKFTQVGGMPALISAGISKMEVIPFTVINAVGSGIKIIALLVIGYYFGMAYEAIAGYFGSFTEVGGIIVAIILAGIYVYFLLDKKSKAKK